LDGNNIGTTTQGTLSSSRTHIKEKKNLLEAKSSEKSVSLGQKKGNNGEGKQWLKEDFTR
jgi:hypothetical protein